MENLIQLLEDSRQQLLSKSRRADNYAASNQHKGKNRFQRRLYSAVSNSTAEFNRINMKKLFDTDILDVNIQVRGETNNYMVKVSFNGVISLLNEQLEQTGKTPEDPIEIHDVLRALTKAFDVTDVYIHCTCPDFCLEGNTKIKLLNGEVITVEELLLRYNNKEELWVYSTDENGDFKPGKITDVWVSGHTKEMTKITLDNGKEIITTPNHRYMLRDGSYKEAKDLIVGQSLMPLYFSYSNGYENVKRNSTVFPSIFDSVYKIVANSELQDEIELAESRSHEEIIQIHHKDFNKLNNYPSNLFPMGKDEHWKYHYEHVFDSGAFDKWVEAGKAYWSTPEARLKQAQICRKTIHNYWDSMDESTYQQACKAIRDRNAKPEVKQRQSQAQKSVWENYTQEQYQNRCNINSESNRKCAGKISISQKLFWENLSDDDSKIRSEMNRQNSEKAWENHDTTLQKIYLSKIKAIIQEILDNHEIPSPETYEKYRGARRIKFTKCFDSWEDLSQALELNHKVKKIETIIYDEEIPVYDLTVDKYNNFYVDAGVVLHNCYRFGWWALANGTSSFSERSSGDWRDKNNRDVENPKVVNQGPEITNPYDNKGAGCKHCLLVLSNSHNWLMKVASVIKNYIQYMEKFHENLYAEKIYPKLYNKEYEKEYQTDFVNTELDTGDEQEDSRIDLANKWAKTKGQWKQGNEYRFQKKQPPLDKKQQTLDFDSLLSDK